MWGKKSHTSHLHISFYNWILHSNYFLPVCYAYRCILLYCTEMLCLKVCLPTLVLHFAFSPDVSTYLQSFWEVEETRDSKRHKRSKTSRGMLTLLSTVEVPETVGLKLKWDVHQDIVFHQQSDITIKSLQEFMLVSNSPTLLPWLLLQFSYGLF